MRRRFPVLLTLLPLALLLGGYWWWWNGRHHAFRAEVERIAPGVPITVTGFPYRLAAESGPAARAFNGGGGTLGIAAQRWSIERQPWRDALSVVGAAAPLVQLSGRTLPTLSIAAAAGRASVNRPERRVSSQFDSARIILAGVLPLLNADRFELHVRVPTAARSGAGAPSERVQLYARGEGVRFSGGAPFAFTLAAAVLSPRPLTSIADWRAGGALRVDELRLTGSKGADLAVLTATLTPSATALRIDGELRTSCPRSFAARLGGPPAPTPEYRTRRPVTLRFSGPLGAERLSEALPEVRPTRTREAPCPRLAG